MKLIREEAAEYLNQLLADKKINEAKEFITKEIDKLEDESQKANWILSVADEFYFNSFFDEAITYYDRALKVTNLKEIKGRALCGIANCFFDKDNFKESVQFSKKALKHAKDKNILQDGYLTLALSLTNLEKYREAIKFYFKVVELSSLDGSELEKERLENSYRFLVTCYWKVGNPKKSDEYFDKLLKMPNVRPYILAGAYGAMGHRRYEKSDFAKACEYYIRAIDLSENNEDANHWKEYLRKTEEEIGKNPRR